jgi:preprotein translocase subunit YajC
LRRFFALESAVIISPAFAQAAPSGDPGYIGLLPIVLMFVLLYFLMIRPQMKRAKETKQMIEALQKGDEVITAGGVVGRITKLGEAYISLEIAPNTEISVQKAAIQVLLPKGTIKRLQ